ncbi:MAG: tRNA (adenosine(37)-N6)-threonylcarbamoyltransferase complex ATPase subunit type 1 TsaE [Acidimicrobiales bacterium]
MSARWSLRVHTDDPAGSRRAGAAIAGVSRPGDLVFLIGGLGAGKTVIAQGFAAALGVDGPVTSPTFTLVRQYRCAAPGPVRQLLHADLYRLDHLREVADLALFELLEEEAVALVEWGDVGAPVLGESALEVSLEPKAGPTESEGRSITVRSRGPGWADRHDALSAVLGALGASHTSERR